jgi:hypothetical protein
MPPPGRPLEVEFTVAPQEVLRPANTAATILVLPFVKERVLTGEQMTVGIPVLANTAGQAELEPLGPLTEKGQTPAAATAVQADLGNPVGTAIRKGRAVGRGIGTAVRPILVPDLGTARRLQGARETVGAPILTVAVETTRNTVRSTSAIVTNALYIGTCLFCVLSRPQTSYKESSDEKLPLSQNVPSV